ncbi:acetolactate synthase large subunit [Caulobacter endophyticus]|uniref:Acetolactate synthase large subunit n=1 Tax=Caulobacter endophyticus TaxID=2172652 RepID=A0A2T9KDU8_9CAUL|nr:acetolactate synthase large subunit [Caulobacter endophyticus]PVM94147.1 acetolactate synthase large subunit [Caulobacter endophyticus]
MNGADALITTLADNGVTACFANPGTSEMQFVSALDREPRMRSILCLFEGVATGAADGYGRIAGRPACTLLHLGPGYANGAANLHNARRAFTPIVNVVGDHATYHRGFDAPLNSDIAALAAPNSLWAKSAETADSVGPLAAEAITASYGTPAGNACLILPADAAWNEATVQGGLAEVPVPAAPDAEAVAAVAHAVKAARAPVLLLGSGACREDGLAAAARLAALGIRVLTDTFTARQARGEGRFRPDKLPYFGEQALKDLDGADLMVLVATERPVAFFAYPDRPSVLVPEHCGLETLCGREVDAAAALNALADALEAPAAGPVEPYAPPPAPAGKLDAWAIGAAIARHMPADAVISDDAVTAGLPIFTQTRAARAHDWLSLTGGAIGQGIPLAIGAAVARPDAKVLALTGDGAGMYTVQGLWTIARERLDVVVVVFANHVYRILGIELGRTGAGAAGPAASKLLDIGDPRIDWVAVSQGMGVPAQRVDTAEAFDEAFERAMAAKGPRLIEAAL